MRKLTMSSIVIILSACLFLAGCGGDDDDDDNDAIGPDGEGGFIGFSGMQSGSWAKYDRSDPAGSTDLYKWLGEDNWEGRQCYLMEFESFTPGEGTTISQMWLDKATGEAVLFLIKTDGNIMRMDLGQIPAIPAGVTGDLDPQTTKIGEDKYTTPTGKTVDVTIYSTDSIGGNYETWISTEVPFGNVKSLYNGQVESQLQDFAFSGAVRSISKEEAVNAESFTFPDIPTDGNNPDVPGGGDIPGGGLIGNVTITVGPGARPTISVSEPIQSLLILQALIPQGAMTVWSFNSPNIGQVGGQAFAGPFQYGVVPNGAESLFPDAPDLEAGSSYTIQVSGINDEGTFLTGTYTFTR